MVNRVVKTAAGGLATVAGIGAAVLKHGVNLTDTFVGGMVNDMAKNFSGSSVKTPIKDTMIKGTTSSLGWFEKTFGKIGKDLRN